MSLFRLSEWFTTNLPQSTTFGVGSLIGGREQVIVGGEDGSITVIDPSISEKPEEAFLAQLNTDSPVVQVAVNHFLQTPGPVVAVLHSHSLAFYTLRYDENDSAATSFQQAFCHELGEPAYCMCIIEAEIPPKILVQTVSCRLHLFQGDQCLFSRTSLPALHPGPVAYQNNTASLVLACGYSIYSIKFSLLSSLSNTGKKVTFDWTFNCGDWPLQVSSVDWPPVPPSVLVMARRNVFCLSAGGTLRWQIRLDAIAVSAIIYRSDDSQTIRFLIALSTNTLLVYKDSQLLWNCHMDFTPVQIARASFGPTYQHVLALLSLEGRFVVGYLGTEPHLYKAAVENRVVDLKAMVEEMKEMERNMRENVSSVTEEAKSFSISTEVVGGESAGPGDVPSSVVRVRFEGLPPGDSPDITVFSCLDHQIQKCAPDGAVISFRTGKTVPWSTVAHLSAHCSNSQASCVSSVRLPLTSLLAETTPDRNSEFKITIEVEGQSVPINQLFPEYNTENPSSIGFQPYGPCDSTVSVFTANKTNKYRIQSDRVELMALVAREFAERIRKQQPGIGLNARAPLEYLHAKVERQIEIDHELKDLNTEMTRTGKELRAIQSLLISKTQNTSTENLDHVDFLYQGAHQQMLSAIDAVVAKKNEKEDMEQQLAALFDIVALLGEFSGGETLVDGQFYGNTQQSLLERLSWATRKVDTADMLESLFQHTSKELPQITEEQEEEFEAPAEPDQLQL